MLVDLVDKKLQREIFVPWLRFFPLKVIISDTGLTRQYQSIRLVSFKPWRNAARRCSVPSGDVLRRNPIIGIAGCYAGLARRPTWSRGMHTEAKAREC